LNEEVEKLESPKFTVPPPPKSGSAELLALKELAGFTKDDPWMYRGKLPRFLFHAYRTLLFGFALGVNIWWSRHVLAMLWQSGREGTKFHLDNTVLIALVTTSIANFLALVAIIARNLFSGVKDANNNASS
jgi:hypothetical protein